MLKNLDELVPSVLTKPSRKSPQCCLCVCVSVKRGRGQQLLHVCDTVSLVVLSPCVWQRQWKGAEAGCDCPGLVWLGADLLKFTLNILTLVPIPFAAINWLKT